MTSKTTTTKRWPAQDAEAHFGALLEASLHEGPQIATRRGVETAVLLPVATSSKAIITPSICPRGDDSTSCS